MTKEELLSLSNEELAELVEICSKNAIAMDGVWFQSVERKFGMDEAIFHDEEAWRRYTVIEAKRIKKFLNLGEAPGLEGLKRALELRVYANANLCRAEFDGKALIYSNVVCRVQAARERKGMPFHPCKGVGVIEYSGFAREIDSRIQCECLSCYPEVADDTCSCKWAFSIPE